MNVLLSCLGLDLDRCDDEGETALHIAAELGHSDVARCLLAAGADPDRFDSRSWTALGVAAARNHADVVRTLLDSSRVDPNLRDRKGRSPIEIASQEGSAEALDMLLAHPLVEFEPGELFHIAARNLRLACVRLLLRRGDRDVGWSDEKGRTALIAAADHRGDDAEVVQLVDGLLAHPGIDINALDRERRSTLFAAIEARNELLAARLLRHKRLDVHAGQSVYRKAAENGLAFLAMLATRDASPFRDDGKALAFAAASLQDEATLSFIQARAAIDAAWTIEGGRTLLHCAAAISPRPAIRYLIEEIGCDPDARDAEGRTPLHAALRLSFRGDPGWRVMLRDGRARLDCRDDRGNTLLHAAIKWPSSSLAVALLLETGAVDVNAINDDGDTALHLAVKEEDEAIVKRLLAHEGIDATIRDRAGLTPMELAAAREHAYIAAKTEAEALLRPG